MIIDFVMVNELPSSLIMDTLKVRKRELSRHKRYTLKGIITGIVQKLFDNLDISFDI
jgi:hypothetical protein